MSMNLNQPKPSGSSAYNTSREYTEAVNDAQVVRTFSFIALAGASLVFIGGVIAVGVGAAVMGFGGKLYYRILGLGRCDLERDQLFCSDIKNHRVLRLMCWSRLESWGNTCNPGKRRER